MVRPGDVLTWRYPLGEKFRDSRDVEWKFNVDRGDKATVVEVEVESSSRYFPGQAVNVLWEKGINQSHGFYSLEWFDPVISPPIDLSRVTSTRSGYPITKLSFDDDSLVAWVRGMKLHFEKDGRFMRGHDNPIDLVEAK